MPEVCAICDSPTANSFHFGAKACKACAAFFRRAVALEVVYVCKGDSPPCYVHCDKRSICKKCRFDKCLSMNMRPELVQSRAGEKTPPVDQDIQETNGSPSPAETPQDVSTPSTSASFDLEGVIKHYSRIQISLNHRRKILYTRTMMRDVFGSRCECPFRKEDLVLFNHRTYKGGSKSDFVAMLDYVKMFPEFEELDSQEQNYLFRYTCATDYMVDAAYYTCRLGMEDMIMVFNDCTFIGMNPLPITGDEPDAMKYFTSKEDLEKYKSLVPPKINHWYSMIIPFAKLQLSFREYSLLKALIAWHICYYRFSDKGRAVCDRQRNVIMSCLLKIAEDDGKDAAERLGELILFISCVFEQVYDLVNSLVMITFFDLLDCDPIIHDLLNHHTY